MKYAFLLFVLISGHFSAAQDAISLKKKIDRIDSLIFYNNFTEGEKETDLLYNSLSKSHTKKDDKDTKLKLLLYKAYIFARKRKTNKALEISFDIMARANEYHLPEKEYQACLMAATMYEHSNDFELCKNYLNRAKELYKTHHLENVYSVYCIRLSSYYRFVKEIDSAIYYAYKGLDYAIRYKNKRERTDACLLLGGLLSRDNYLEAVKYSSLAANDFLHKRDYEGAAAMYNNIASTYLHHKEAEKALLYSDSASWVFNTNSLPEADHFLRIRYRLFDTLGHKDSAYHYLKKYHDTYVKELGRMEAAAIKKITEQYQNDKKETVIKNKNQQLIFIVILLVMIVLVSVLLLRKNKKINIQNKVISKQVKELVKTLEQKQVLLSELQHRVKNNLQHVISILEIQKESIDFNNIEELIRGNQNRIHSMALLHKKLNTSDRVNYIDLRRYINELSELVKNSYENGKKKINLEIQCEIEEISLEKALPIGLIVVELISNSIKHAFIKQNIGNINVVILKDESTKKNKLFYADNGIGFDFNLIAPKGLGIEIIKGLIDQLDGTTITKQTRGFELTIYF
nr:sensor histidine kinase [Pedobacter sp. ASV28]